MFQILRITLPETLQLLCRAFLFEALLWFENGEVNEEGGGGG